MHRDSPPFSKWDALQHEEARRRRQSDPAGSPDPGAPGEAPTSTESPPRSDEEDPPRSGSGPTPSTDQAAKRRRLHTKMWILRTAWLVSTGMLVFGALLMILVLSGHGHLIGI